MVNHASGSQLHVTIVIPNIRQEDIRVGLIVAHNTDWLKVGRDL